MPQPFYRAPSWRETFPFTPMVLLLELAWLWGMLFGSCWPGNACGLFSGFVSGPGHFLGLFLLAVVPAWIPFLVILKVVLLSWAGLFKKMGTFSTLCGIAVGVASLYYLPGEFVLHLPASSGDRAILKDSALVALLYSVFFGAACVAAKAVFSA